MKMTTVMLTPIDPQVLVLEDAGRATVLCRYAGGPNPHGWAPGELIAARADAPFDALVLVLAGHGVKLSLLPADAPPAAPARKAVRK